MLARAVASTMLSTIGSLSWKLIRAAFESDLFIKVAHVALLHLGDGTESTAFTLVLQGLFEDFVQRNRGHYEVRSVLDGRGKKCGVRAVDEILPPTPKNPRCCS